MTHQKSRVAGSRFSERQVCRGGGDAVDAESGKRLRGSHGVFLPEAATRDATVLRRLAIRSAPLGHGVG
ncbi:unnamed protein product, partial [Iphiclides podalirius]